MATAQARTQRYGGRSADAVRPTASPAPRSIQGARPPGTAAADVREEATMPPTRADVSAKQQDQLAPSRSPRRQAGQRRRPTAATGSSKRTVTAETSIESLVRPAAISRLKKELLRRSR